jgi:hypothetical protein
LSIYKNFRDFCKYFIIYKLSIVVPEWLRKSQGEILR